ncbi:hypothetical protein SEA_SERENITY_82 [Mycobacterium phage Serenity]|uniref:hypothetical protein n=1 Tax=Mycobacterium phage Serenity TaxID=1701853 RepID=UPI0006CE3784|nr:hypothetical protein SEA_SERENITY_82 [Mycobacterium phage Serenity]ALF00949.1 hypothetical protein SEA_SERENITY_82 [Mycobacterium phage Serenity]
MIETLGDIVQMARNPKTGREPGDNTYNCTWAAVALSAYTKVVGGDDNEVGTQISDLLGDLLHLADAAGVDFYEALATAETNYKAEVNGE